MNLAVLGLQALRAVELEPHSQKIHISRKLITDFEKHPDQASHRVCIALRRVLKLVTADPSASKDDQNEAKRLLFRIRSFDPRRNPLGPDEAEPADLDPVAEHRQRVKPKPPAHPVPDGYQPEFINITEALSRVSTKYMQKPKWTNLENENLVQVALADIPLDSHSAGQLWLALGYEWKALGGCFDSGKRFSELMAPQADWIQSAICSFANRNQIVLPTPNVFSLTDDIASRS